MSDPNKDDRHRCEVASLLRMYPRGEKVREYLVLVEKARGKAAHDRLRADVMVLWMDRKAADDMAGQA